MSEQRRSLWHVDVSLTLLQIQEIGLVHRDEVDEGVSSGDSTTVVLSYSPVVFDCNTEVFYCRALLKSCSSTAVEPLCVQYIKDFYNRTALRRSGRGLGAETLTLMYSLTVSVFAIGGLLGSLVVGVLVTRYGRSVT